jgi:hypothetical protein
MLQFHKISIPGNITSFIQKAQVAFLRPKHLEIRLASGTGCIASLIRKMIANAISAA